MVFSNWSNGDRVSYLRANSDAGYGQINVKVNSSTGNISTYAPTPVTTSNDNNIATTAFVNNRLPYTTGTFTPTLYGSSTAGVFTYSKQYGYYCKIGHLCFVSFNIVTSGYTTHPVGTVRVGGLPFNGVNNTNTNINGSFVVLGDGGVDNSANKIYNGFVVNTGGYMHFSAHNSTSPHLRYDATFNASSSDGVNVMFNSTYKTLWLIVSGIYYTA